MRFSEEFYKPEVRDGFYVSSRMKRTWAATLEVYEAVRKVCEDNNIPYYADWGTLLGAVRHGGFIPWDDDFDISMKREDYMRFIEVAYNAMPDGFVLLNVHTEHEYENLLTRVVNRKEISYDRDFMEKYHGFPYNVGIDIFPLDYVSRDKKKEETRRQLVKVIQGYVNSYEADEIFLHEDWTKSEILEMGEYLHMPIVEGRYIRQQLFQLMEIAFSIYVAEDADMIASLAQEVSGLNKPVPLSYYDDVINIKFENTEVVVPLLYDAMLEIRYPNYMRVVKDCAGHNYPVYLGLEKEIRRSGKRVPWLDYTPLRAKKDIDDKSRERDKICTNKDVVFMPYRASSWKYMEPLWLLLQEDNSVTTYVMPIPYYDKDVLGELGDFHYEGDMFPDYVPVIAFDKYDLESRHPERIVIQNPYDEYDTSISVPPFFYSKRIKEFTDCLIYTPDFVMDEFGANDQRSMYNMQFYCNSPGVINSDEVYVQSENIRERYIESLTEFAGEESRNIWNNKIKVAPWIISEDDVQGISEDEIPNEWWDKLLKPDGTGKKVLLYYNSVSCLARYKEDYLRKIEKTFQSLEQRSDEITVILRPDESINELLSGKYNSLAQEYNEVKEKYGNRPYVILDESKGWHKAVAISDAFYGDGGYILKSFIRTKRPAMIQNINA